MSLIQIYLDHFVDGRYGFFISAYHGSRGSLASPARRKCQLGFRHCKDGGKKEDDDQKLVHFLLLDTEHCRKIGSADVSDAPVPRHSVFILNLQMKEASVVLICLQLSKGKLFAMCMVSQTETLR